MALWRRSSRVLVRKFLAATSQLRAVVIECADGIVAYVVGGQPDLTGAMA